MSDSNCLIIAFRLHYVLPAVVSNWATKGLCELP